MAKKTRVIVRGRDAGNGQFIPVEKARKLGDRAIVDRMKAPAKKSKSD